MKSLTKNLAIIIAIFLLVSLLFTLVDSSFEEKEEIPFSTLVRQIEQGEVEKITVSGNDVSVFYNDETEAKSRKEAETSLLEQLVSYGISAENLRSLDIETKKEAGAWLWPLFITLFPFFLFVLIILFMFRRARTGVTQTFNFTKAKARLFGAEGHSKERISFKDVAGLKEAKEELKEVVDFLKFPKKYLKMGARIPRGALLLGGAGVGKTMLARAVAGEAGVPFFHISGSEFVEMFVGVGASVTGDTPVLIKTENSTKLMPISEFVDKYYSGEKENYTVPVSGVKTLGHEPLKTGFRGVSEKKNFFGKSRWQKVQKVFRHKVSEIYEIHYLGGVIKTTGDHSVFVRCKNFIKAKKASQLKPGEVLVNLPFKVRSSFIPGVGTTHKVKAHEFSESSVELPVWNENLQFEKSQEDYQFALAGRGQMSQKEIAGKIGVSQGTVGFWQRGMNKPRYFDIASRYEKKGIPQKVQASPSLMRLLGYYTAEGRRTDYYLQFVFGAHEKELHKDCADLMRETFNIEPHLEYTADNALRITYFSKFLGDFFENHCGNGSKKKHVPEFLWSLPKNYFTEYFKGWTRGDGYTDKKGNLCGGSTSKQLILELSWLCAMHGIQASIAKKISKEGHIIKSRPLPESIYWVLKIGKTSHPFKDAKFSSQLKKPVIRKVVKKPYNDYVYDLCGCKNEAFFGGEKPVLLHNSRVRDLFSTAKKASPSIIFVDELDAIGRQRGTGLGGGHDEKEQTLNQILVEMDGFERETNVIVMAATNRGDVLDPALLRPGRFDRKIILDPPDVHDREELLRIHAKEKPLAIDVNFKEVAERTPGFSGAEVANVVNEAAILAARKNKNQINQEEFLESIEKVLLGPERKSHILTKKEKEIAAYHEAGHALVSTLLSDAEPVRKISIISRGMAAGYTIQLPKEEKKMKTKKEFLAEMATFLGGYCAEKIIFDETTTGASNDLKGVSALARKLVKEYGMSPLGPISFGNNGEPVFLGKEMSEQRNYSEKIAALIDNEVEKFVKSAEKEALETLKKNKGTLEKIAKTLIKKETIEREEYEKLIGSSKKKPKNSSKKT